MKKKLEVLSTEFNTYTVLLHLCGSHKDKEKLTEEEQAVLDGHKDNIEDLMERVKTS